MSERIEDVPASAREYLASMPDAVPKVYAAISAVQAELAKTGIGKDSKNDQQGYKFRGIDAVFNALSPILVKHRLCILPRMLTREVVERVSGNNKALFYVTVEAEFDFVSADDGSRHIVRTFGEAMDSGDKATNKAMSAAYKYAAFQAFAIPTEGDNDADATTHEVIPKRESEPDGYQEWKMNMATVADEGIERLQDVWKSSSAALRNFAVKYDLEWWNGCKQRALPKGA